MAGKRVWLTWMPTGPQAPAPQQAIAALSRVGLQVQGAPWIDDLEKMAWAELGDHLAAADGDEVWLIAGRGADLALSSNRYGLSLTMARVRSSRDPMPAVIVVGLDGAIAAATLPTLLRGCRTFDGSSAWAERVLAATLGKPAAPADSFRLNVLADPTIGQWFEVGPAATTWKGAMFGIAGGGAIDNHAVGPAGGLPERTVLEYALEGIEAEIGDDTYTAWAVQNEIGPEQSYYLKVTGHPARLIIGEHPDSGAEVSVLCL